MKYANINKDGKILGWYDSEMHNTIPRPNVEIEEEQWQEAINLNANCYENGKFIVKDFRTNEEKEKELLLIEISTKKDYLNKTDHKLLNGYVPKDGEDLTEIEATRNEYREFIRANKEGTK